MKQSTLSSTQTFDYQERYIDVLYHGGLDGRIFMKISIIFNTQILFQQHSFLYTETEFSKISTFDF